jgi:hypothetical protein
VGNRFGTAPELSTRNECSRLSAAFPRLDLAVLREGRLVRATEWPRPVSTHLERAVGPDRQLRVPVSHDSTSAIDFRIDETETDVLHAD